MARAYRNFLPGYIWHITQRCHKKEFLLKFRKDKYLWCRWILEGRKRYDLCILNFMITSNHIHLLVLDRDEGKAIAKSLHLASGRLGQDYNKRKNRSGAYWEDRYHATAIENGTHFINCLTYLDLNMVRAGVVEHPYHWEFCGYHELQKPRLRHRNELVDEYALMHLLGMNAFRDVRTARQQWVDDALKAGNIERDPKWTEGVAVGNVGFLAEIKEKLGGRAKGKSLLGGMAQGRELWENRNSVE